MAAELAANPNPLPDVPDAAADGKTAAEGATAPAPVAAAGGGGGGSPVKSKSEPGWLAKAAMKTAAALKGGADTGKSLFAALATGNLTVDGGGVRVVDDRLETRVSRQVRLLARLEMLLSPCICSHPGTPTCRRRAPGAPLWPAWKCV